MTTTAPRPETEQRVAEREAWEDYRDSLRHLHGRDYDEAEHASWERLQHRLREIARESAG